MASCNLVALGEFISVVYRVSITSGPSSVHRILCNHCFRILKGIRETREKNRPGFLSQEQLNRAEFIRVTSCFEVLRKNPCQILRYRVVSGTLCRQVRWTLRKATIAGPGDLVHSCDMSSQHDFIQWTATNRRFKIYRGQRLLAARQVVMTFRGPESVRVPMCSSHAKLPFRGQ
jgi:hypothetical protein